MKIKQMYLVDFIKKCEKMGFKVEYNDETGIYYFPDMDLIMKAWNGKIEIGENFRNNELTNFIDLYNEIKYYIEWEDSDETK